jgi:hypothetical protein
MPDPEGSETAAATRSEVPAAQAGLDTGRQWLSGWVATGGNLKEAAALFTAALGALGTVGHLTWRLAAAGPEKLAERAEQAAKDSLQWLPLATALFILFMWVALSRRPAKGAEAQVRGLLSGIGSDAGEVARASREAHRFRTYFEFLLGSWVALYSVLWVAHARYRDQTMEGTVHERLHLGSIAANVASIVCLVLCYQAVGGYSRFWSPLKQQEPPESRGGTDREMGPREKLPIAVGVLVVLLAVAARRGLVAPWVSPENTSLVVGFASGLGNAIAMGLLAGRVASPALGGGAAMAVALHLYAAIQPAFGLFLDHVVVEFFAICLALPLKAILFWIVSRSIRDGSLVALIALTRTRQLQDGMVRGEAAGRVRDRRSL